MSRISKAIGALVGGVVGVIAAYFSLPETMEAQIVEFLVPAAIGILGPVIGAYLAPKNTN